MTDLSIEACGIRYPNPFVLASGPPGTNGKVIQRSFELGWGGIVCKTISLESDKVVNTVPRYGKLKNRQDQKEVIGFQNIELISDRPFEIWLKELRECKEAYPDHVLIASIMEEYRKDAWVEIVERTQETGVDAFELNLSCPHGLPERRMGAAMGQDPEIVEEVTSWAKEASSIPVYSKMTPNITDPAIPARAAINGGVDGMLDDLDSLSEMDMQEENQPWPEGTCPVCEARVKPATKRPGALPRCMKFNKVVGIDLVEFQEQIALLI